MLSNEDQLFGCSIKQDGANEYSVSQCVARGFASMSALIAAGRRLGDRPPAAPQRSKCWDT
ncbi:hypothetical protein FRC08_001211, partial [Ceratobasidium sp. 394]